jgi:hypothetical protein
MKAIYDLYCGAPYFDPAIQFRIPKISFELTSYKTCEVQVYIHSYLYEHAFEKLPTKLENCHLFYFTLFCQYYHVKSVITSR